MTTTTVTQNMARFLINWLGVMVVRLRSWEDALQKNKGPQLVNPVIN
jgi:hypothetical protein